MISKADVRLGRSAAVTFKDIARANWERIFGTAEQTAKKRRAAIAAAKRPSAQTAGLTANATAIHGDKLFAGYDPALRMVIRGRTHRREVMKERGLRCAYD